jgi:hypothetical protein
MLTLSLNKTQSVVINDDITISLVECCGESVRLGIVAPKGILLQLGVETRDVDHDSEGPGLAGVASRLRPVKPSGGQTVALRPPVSDSDSNK